MKIKLILTSLLIAVSAKGFAQDIIHTLDSSPIEAKVTEITDDAVRYKTFDNLDGPDYVIPTSRVARILFENGTEKVFSHKKDASDEEDLGPYGPIVYHWGSFYDDRGRLYGKQMRKYLADTPYIGDYKKARNQFLWGSGLTVGGATLVLSAIAGGTFFAIMNSRYTEAGATTSLSSKLPAVFIGTGLAGAACVGAGIPLWIKGNRELGAITDEYNRQFGHESNASLQVGITGNGIGFALRF